MSAFFIPHLHSLFHVCILYSMSAFFIPHLNSLFHVCILYSTSAFFIPRLHSLFHVCILYSMSAFFIPHLHSLFHVCILYSRTECDCDPTGALYEGECDRMTEPEFNMEAGRCRCKTFVTGRRCDSCVAGYWNMQESNQDGCEGMGLTSHWCLKYNMSCDDKDVLALSRNCLVYGTKQICLLSVCCNLFKKTQYVL